MVTPGKKHNTKPKKNSKEWFDEWLKTHNSYGPYYQTGYGRVKEDFFKRRSLNCSDFDDMEEFVNRLKGAYIREHIMRKPTDEELEWINKQEEVTDPEVLESLRPALEWLQKYVFCVEDNE